jgi:hypothetical protein
MKHFLENNFSQIGKAIRHRKPMTSSIAIIIPDAQPLL